MKTTKVNGLSQFEQEILRKYLISKKLDYKYFLSKFYSQDEHIFGIDIDPRAVKRTKTYEYLLFCKDILVKRDKGKKEYETWYSYGRTQGINTTFGKKILTPPMALNPTFVVCEKEDSTFYSGYGIFLKIRPFTDLYLLKKILNSEIMRVYIESTSKSYRGGWKS